MLVTNSSHSFRSRPMSVSEAFNPSTKPVGNSLNNALQPAP